MRILIHAVSAKPRGGADRHLTNFLPALGAADRANEYIVCVNARFPLAALPKNIEVMPVQVAGAAQRLLWDQVRLPRLARRRDVDLIVAILSFGCVRPPCCQITFARSPLFCRYYLDGLTWSERFSVRLRRLFMFLTMRASTVVVTPTDGMRDMILRACPSLRKDRFRRILHALERQDRTARPMRSASAAEAAPARLLYVGHLLPYKGFDTLLDALTRLMADGVNFSMDLTIAREDWPDGFDRFERAVAAAGLTGRLRILGKVPLERVNELYAAADVLVYPSLCESFGFPMIEAMRYGLPIVSVDTAVNRELARDAALYYAPFDGAAAAQAIARLARDPSERARLAENGRNLAGQHLDWDQYAAACVRLFGDVLGRTKMGQPA